MARSFFFYDLETSGLRAGQDRIMQFSGQRTTPELEPIGPAYDTLIKLTPDVLPDPDAVMLTGITPQQTLAHGVTEAAFLRQFYKEMAIAETVFVGFNNIRFDDEFIRFLNYRNFYDAYAWQWQNRRSRWDILDLTRMTRALRPDGINWPFDETGKPINKLERLTKLNGLDHDSAHNAASDMQATIKVAKLILDKQPKLFNYLLKMKSKASVAHLVEQDQPFVYTSSHYPSAWLHTTVVKTVVPHPNLDGALVYDLRFDPSPFLSMNADELAQAWRFSDDPSALRLPVKTLKYNRAPAVAPMTVIDEPTRERLKLDSEQLKRNQELLTSHQAQFGKTLIRAVELMDQTRAANQTALPLNVDGSLYEGGFISRPDQSLMAVLRDAAPDQFSELRYKFQDKRLRQLVPLYKARNYPGELSASEQAEWQTYCETRLNSGGKSSRLNRYQERLHVLEKRTLTKRQQVLLDKLRTYGETVLELTLRQSL